MVCNALVAGGRWSGAGQQAMRPGWGKLCDSHNFPHPGRIACCSTLNSRPPATKALHTICGNNTSIVSSSWWWAYHHHYHHVPEGLGVFPFPWSSRWSWSLHLFLGRPMFLRPFGLHYSACFGSLFVSILCTCCSHFFWYCFISFTMFCAHVFCLVHWFFSLSSFVIPSKCLKNFICAASKSCWWAYKCPKYVEQIIRAIKHSVASSWFPFLRLS